MQMTKGPCPFGAGVRVGGRAPPKGPTGGSTVSKDLIPARLDTAGPLALVTFVCCRVHHAISLSFGGGAGRDLCPQDRGQGRRGRA